MNYIEGEMPSRMEDEIEEMLDFYQDIGEIEGWHKEC